MTRAICLALFVGLISFESMGPSPGALCALGQQSVAAQAAPEHRTPPGTWCQRPEPQMDRRAHACACHQHDCAHPDVPPSAHTDPQCKNYCFENQCRCEKHDCP